MCFENMGLAYENLKEYEISLLFYEDCLKLKNLIFGNNHMRLSSTLQKLVRVQRILGRD